MNELEKFIRMVKGKGYEFYNMESQKVFKSTNEVLSRMKKGETVHYRPRTN